MPAFQTLGGGDCGASWVSASRLHKKSPHSRARGIDNPSPSRIREILGGTDIFRWFRRSLTSSSPFPLIPAPPPPVPRPPASPRRPGRVACHAKRRTPINCTRYKGLVSTIFARAFVFIQLIVCQVFQSGCYRLAVSSLHNFIEIFSEMRSDIFLRVRRYQSPCYQKLSAPHIETFLIMP